MKGDAEMRRLLSCNRGGGQIRYFDMVRETAEHRREYLNRDGGEGSGNWGHKGRPGSRGGSGKGGGAPKGFARRMMDYVSGGYGLDELLENTDYAYVRSRMKKTDKPLYRVEEARFTAKKLKPGAVFSFNGDLRSFTRSRDVITHDFMNPMSDMYVPMKNTAIFRTVGDCKHFDVEPFAKSFNKAFDTNQHESLVGGKFKVLEMKEQRIHGLTATVVYIAQINT